MNEEKNQNPVNDPVSYTPPPTNAPAYDPQKKILAGILAIVVGSFGVHKFILGYQKEGFIMLGVSLVGILTSCFFIGVLPWTAMGIIGLVEGIIYLTKSDQEFYDTYIKNQKPWF